jgi:hypothetical protein
MNGFKAVFGVAVLGTALFGAAAAYGAGMPAGGSVHVFATPGPTGTILITGAIGDYGKTLDINASGKAVANGRYVKVTLKQGTFVINAVAFNVKLAKLNPGVDKATCSAEGSGTGPVSLIDGTGLYKGISATLSATATFAFIAPRFTSGKDKGQCNLSNSAQPLDQYSSIDATGTVHFS